MKHLIKKLLKEGLENIVYGHRYQDLLYNIKQPNAEAGDEPKELLDYKIKHLIELEETPSVTLYRVIYIKDINQLNVSELGHHYVHSLEDLHEGMLDYLYYNAKKENSDITEEDLYYMTVETPTTNIDYHETIRTFSEHPWENEITIKDSSKVKLIDVESYYV